MLKSESTVIEPSISSQLLKLKETEIEQLQQRLPATSEPQPYGEG